jgi:hypothetical protein
MVPVLSHCCIRLSVCSKSMPLKSVGFFLNHTEQGSKVQHKCQCIILKVSFAMAENMHQTESTDVKHLRPRNAIRASFDIGKPKN